MNDESDYRFDELDSQRKEANGFYIKNSSVYRAFLDMEKAAYAPGALTKLEKELIAVGISVVINCESCMQWHISQAAASGATKEQLIEAVGVGIEMGGGPATVSSRFAMRAINRYMPK